MTTMQSGAPKPLPNVLHDQTMPNTLTGIGPPAPAAMRRVPVGTLAVAAGVAIALLLALLSRAA